MTYSKITDHVIRAQKRLIEQYKDKSGINSLVDSFVSPVQILEDEIYKTYTERWILTSQGEQVDGIGKIVGELRLGRNDIDYKLGIITRIYMNTAAGEPDTIISIIDQILKPDLIDYAELYPANYQLYLQSISQLSFDVRAVLDSVNPAGVGQPIITYSQTSTPFVFSEIGSEVNGFQLQSGSFYNEELTDLEIVFSIGNNYTLEVSNETIIEDDAGQGFAEIILTKATLDVGGFDYDIGDGTLLELKLTSDTEDYIVSFYGGNLVEVI